MAVTHKKDLLYRHGNQCKVRSDRLRTNKRERLRVAASTINRKEIASNNNCSRMGIYMWTSVNGLAIIVCLLSKMRANLSRFQTLNDILDRSHLLMILLNVC